MQDTLNSSPTELLKQLRPVSFNFKNSAEAKQLRFGFIADEVEAVLPQVVRDLPESQQADRRVGERPYRGTFSFHQHFFIMTRSERNCLVRNRDLAKFQFKYICLNVSNRYLLWWFHCGAHLHIAEPRRAHVRGRIPKCPAWQSTFFFAISIRIFELWTFSRNEFIVFGSNSNDFIHVSTIWILQL